MHNDKRVDLWILAVIYGRIVMLTIPEKNTPHLSGVGKI